MFLSHLTNYNTIFFFLVTRVLKNGKILFKSEKVRRVHHAYCQAQQMFCGWHLKRISTHLDLCMQCLALPKWIPQRILKVLGLGTKLKTRMTPIPKLNQHQNQKVIHYKRSFDNALSSCMCSFFSFKVHEINK